MAYRASSTSSVFAKSPIPLVERIADRLTAGYGVWVYRSTHAHAEIEAAGFFTDGKRDGLRLGDLLFNVNYSSAGSSAATLHVVSASSGAVATSDTAGSSAFSQAYNVSVSVCSTA